MTRTSDSEVESAVTGHLQVRGTGSSRRWVALYIDRDGVHRTKTLGPTWVADSGRRTERGAVVWKAAGGACPEGALTPKAAKLELDDLLARTRDAPRRAIVQKRTTLGPTFGQLVDDWRDYLQIERKRKRSTVQDARNTARRHLVAHFGEDRELQTVRHVEIRENRDGRNVIEHREERTDTITTAEVDELRRKLLKTDLSPRTVQKVMVLLHGLLKYGQRRGMINVNAAAHAERVTVVDDEGFNVLEPIEFEAVYRAVIAGEVHPQEDQRDVIDDLSDAIRQTVAALLATAFYAGPRLGELRDLTWAAVDFDKSLIYVRSSYTHGERSSTKGGRVRAVPLVPQLGQRLADLATRDQFTGDGDYVFHNALGQRVDDALVREVFYAALARAEMGHKRDKVDQHGNAQEPIRVHDLRHSYCTWAVNVWDVTLVQKYAGHRHIQTTMRYVHRVAKTEHADEGGAYLASVLGESVAA